MKKKQTKNVKKPKKKKNIDMRKEKRKKERERVRKTGNEGKMCDVRKVERRTT